MKTRTIGVTAALLGAAVAFPTSAFAHAGLGGRSDLPIPQWLFAWGVGILLVISFVGLAVLWPSPRLQRPRWRPLPGGAGRLLAGTPVEIVCGAIGVALYVLVAYAGFAGNQTVVANFSPTFVLVIFWVALVPVSVLFGDVFRAFNPWRAIGRAVAWVARKANRGELPAPLAYPERLGHWPATATILAFATAELAVWAAAPPPNEVAVATLIYSGITFVGMALYGIDAWIERAEGFSVYFNLFARMSVFETRERVLGVRTPLAGLSQLHVMPGTVALLAVMIGSVSFDGFAEGPQWSAVAPDIATFFRDLGLTPEHALWVTTFIGLMLAVAFVYALYLIGVIGARAVGGGFTREQVARNFVPTLVPIALAYVSAHYFTYLLYNGQPISALASDPLGHGSDFFGTADATVSYFLGASLVWYFQVAFVVTGHAAGLTLAHDKALATYDRARLAVRSQYWMLFVMLAFSGLAIWILSESNT